MPSPLLRLCLVGEFLLGGATFLERGICPTLSTKSGYTKSLETEISSPSTSTRKRSPLSLLITPLTLAYFGCLIRQGIEILLPTDELLSVDRGELSSPPSTRRASDNF